MSLRGQIALLVSTAVLLTCGVMFGINIVFDRNQTIAKGDSGLRLLALYVSGQLANRFDNVSGKADQLARRASENTPVYSKEIYDLMEQYYGLDPDIYGGAIAFDAQKFSERQRLFCLFLAKNATGAFDRGRLPPEYDYLDPSQPKNSWFTIPKTTGRPTWTLPFFDEGGGDAWMLTYAAPFTKNGEFAGTVNVDVSLNSPVLWMNDVLSNSPGEVTEYGSCFLTDSTGVLVSHTDTRAVENRKNIREYLKAEIPDAALEAENGAVVRARNYFDGSGNWVRVAKTPVGRTGWYLYAITDENASLRDFYGRLNRTVIWMAIMLAAFLWSLRWFTKRLTAPLIRSAAFATRLKDGHLSDRMESPHQLECGNLVDALNDMAKTLEKRTLEKEKALQTQDSIFRHVTVVAEELTQLAVDIHHQSEEGVRDANHQQKTFSEFGAALGAFGTHTSHTAAASSRADQLLQDARERAGTGTVEMGRLTSAMSDLIKASSEISRVVKTIDSIAFQTNLLSLNAAVEAAHAGRHGKGFGVVAEEVRQLANRSARAATETNAMLSQSERFAEDGVNAGRQTTETLEAIRHTTENVAALISDVAKLSQEQATMLEQVLSGLVQVEQIADGNRRRAEREASAAEELRSTAEALRELLLSSKE